jgi:hypothetical protein
MKTEGPSNQYRAHRSSVGIVFTTSNRDLYVITYLKKMFQAIVYGAMPLCQKVGDLGSKMEEFQPFPLVQRQTTTYYCNIEYYTYTPNHHV